MVSLIQLLTYSPSSRYVMRKMKHSQKRRKTYIFEWRKTDMTRAKVKLMGSKRWKTDRKKIYIHVGINVRNTWTFNQPQIHRQRGHVLCEKCPNAKLDFRRWQPCRCAERTSTSTCNSSWPYPSQGVVPKLKLQQIIFLRKLSSELGRAG